MMSNKLKTRFFGGNYEGIEYDTPQEIATFLVQRPGMVDVYQEKMIELAEGMAGWGDLVGMREQFNFLVDVLELLHDVEFQKAHVKAGPE
jgi:hypothetical protein